MRNRARLYKDHPEIFKQAARPVQSLDPVQALNELLSRIETDNEQYLAELRYLLKRAEGTEFESGDQLRDFKRVFTRICDRLGVGPLLPSGRRGTLQVAGRSKDKGYPHLHSAKEHASCGVPANTVPRIHLG